MYRQASRSENGFLQLAAAYGIESQWQDDLEQDHLVPATTISAMLKSSGVSSDSSEQIDKELLSLAETVLEPVYVWKKSIVDSGQAEIQLFLPEANNDSRLTWLINTESGGSHSGACLLGELSDSRAEHASTVKGWVGKVLKVSCHLDPGYHRLHLTITEESGNCRGNWQAQLVVVPDKCYLPESMEGGHRTWGPAVHLASLRSSRNWGVGDFSDLKELVDWCATEGAGWLSLKPLQRVRTTILSKTGWPAVSSRSFIDPIYLDVEKIADFSESEEIRRSVLAPQFQERTQVLRDLPVVDYLAVASLKKSVLSALYKHFRQEHLNTASARAEEFRRFQADGGQHLELFARHEALSDWFDESDNCPSWTSWPEAYRQPGSPAVEEFAAANRERVEYFQYLQWQIDVQLQEAGRRCLELELPIGLALTMPFGIDRQGADTWQFRALFAEDGSAGSQPVDSTHLGDCWETAALLPRRLKEKAYQPLIDALRLCMRHAGALNVEYICSYNRAFFIPDGLEPDESTYWRYCLDDILGIIALESHRQRCMVIGRDLDIGFRRHPENEETLLAMTDRGIFLHTSLYRQKHGSAYEPPSTHPAQALFTFAQDNLPSWRAYWLGHDLSMQNLDSSNKDLRDKLMSERIHNRMELLRLLESEDLLPHGVTIDPLSVADASPHLAAAVYAAMAASPCQLIQFDFEDAMPECSAIAPTTWLKKLPADLRDLSEHYGVQALVKQMRTRRSIYRSEGKLQSDSRGITKQIPASTYRLQFNRDFTFARAAQLVPYLSRLGISHLYASPLLKARPGSKHCYDIVSHKELNPELGTIDDFRHLVSELRRHGMGLILDVVPNHMGIGKDNPWWMDVLENGPASLFADYFDIDWNPVKPELKGKVLLPLLGESYGRCLTGGQLKLCFRPHEGRLFLQYYEHEFPINPASYPIVLGHRLDVLKERLGKDNLDVLEFQSILAALERLPNHIEPVGFAERLREKHFQLVRLSALCSRNGDIAEFINQNLRDFEYKENDSTTAHRLHDLLQVQAYRLATWRVASDEINYRRFFDVNSLAAIRVEDARVFLEVHELLFQLIQEKLVDGLRIDHPDGLFDPAAYFAKLQSCSATRLGLVNVGSEQYDAGSDKLPFYIVVEKVLAPFEHLEADFAVSGTTGYDFLNAVNQLLVYSANESRLQKIYEEFTGQNLDYDKLKYVCRTLILETVLNSELHVLANRLNKISESNWFSRDYTFNSLRHALSQIVTHFPVYRTYATPQRIDKTARQYIDWAVKQAKKRSVVVDNSIYDFIRSVLAMEPIDSSYGKESESRQLQNDIQLFAMQFQQFTGPVMAKSIEDTLFYRYNRLISLNEVGGEPHRFGSTINAFHHQNQERQRRRPHELIATSSHDTKRSEDVRARLAVLSEIPTVWRDTTLSWAMANSNYKTLLDEMKAPDTNDEYMLYQILVGAFPYGQYHRQAIASFKERLIDFALKAAREAKQYTSWIRENHAYEQALTKFIDKFVSGMESNEDFLTGFARFHKPLCEAGFINTLVQTALKMTSPGIPDIYQGNELLDLSLVDPDNRRPVDFAKREAYLEEIARFTEENFPAWQSDSSDARRTADCDSFLQAIEKDWTDGRAKLYLTARALAYRKANPELFTRGKYTALEVNGSGKQHLVAFLREHGKERLLVAAPLHTATLLNKDDLTRYFQGSWAEALRQDETWLDTEIILPEGPMPSQWRNLLTGERICTPVGNVLANTIFKQFPVALLRSI